MLIQPVINQIITNKIQNNRIMQSKKSKSSTEQTMTALPTYADAKSFVNISFKARIHDCAKAGDWEGVKRELDNGVDVNLRDEDGWTALMNAACKGDTDIVKELLKHPDIDVNLQDNDYWTALILASYNGHTEIVAELLRHPDIDVNVKNGSGYTALMQASYKDNPEAVRELLKHPDINVNLQDNYDNTALLWASFKHNQKAIRELLKHPDIDVNLTDEFGKTALDYANAEIREMIQNYVRGTDKREGVLSKEVLSEQVDIKKLTLFDEIWTDEEKQNLEKLIETKDFKALAKFFESKGTELNEKYRYLITDTDKLREQIRISETATIRKEENEKAQKAIQDRITELEKEKAEYEEKSIALDNIMKNFQDLLAEGIASERENLESGIRTLHGIKPDNLPENMTLGEQMNYVTDILISRKSKLTGTDMKTPERITIALQDNSQKISNSGLKFLEKIIDIIDGTCEENDIINAIESVKGNYGIINMAAVSFFISTLAWNGNNIRAVTEHVRKNAAKACKR